MNFMFLWQEQCLTRSLRSLVRYCSCHSNIKFISSRHRVIFSIYYLCFVIFWLLGYFSSIIGYLNVAARKSVRFDKTISRGKINQDKSIHKEIMVKIYISEILQNFKFLFSRISSTLILAPIDPILFMLLTHTTPGLPVALWTPA